MLERQLLLLQLLRLRLLLLLGSVRGVDPLADDLLHRLSLFVDLDLLLLLGQILRGLNPLLLDQLLLKGDCVDCRRVINWADRHGSAPRFRWARFRSAEQ